MTQENLQVPGKGTADSIKQNNTDKIHPLELKYGKEPKIEPQEHWSWH